MRLDLLLKLYSLSISEQFMTSELSFFSKYYNNIMSISISTTDSHSVSHYRQCLYKVLCKLVRFSRAMRSLSLIKKVANLVHHREVLIP